ncbi:hypothetical protein Q1695_001677 [Nippostrongylus brasiliensis]|nr:hypothetical protein Q1695_001677 [Nippostrongylus brasiliensis]
METDCHKISIVAHEPQFANNRFKILVVGRRECGKSALIRRLQRNTFENSKDIPEVVVVIRAVHGSIVKVDLVAVDICKFLGDDPITDQARVDFVKHSFDMSGLFLLYDTTNAETFAEIDEVLRVLKRMVPPDVDVCIVGTKADLVDSRKVSYDEAERKSQQLGYSLFETSALTGLNCDDVLLETLDKLSERRREIRDYLLETTEVCIIRWYLS